MRKVCHAESISRKPLLQSYPQSCHPELVSGSHSNHFHNLTLNLVILNSFQDLTQTTSSILSFRPQEESHNPLPQNTSTISVVNRKSQIVNQKPTSTNLLVNPKSQIVNFKSIFSSITKTSF